MALTSHPPGTSPASCKCIDSRIRAPESPLPGSRPPAPAVPHESGSLLKSRAQACAHRVLPSHEHSKSNYQCEATYELLSKKANDRVQQLRVRQKSLPTRIPLAQALPNRELVKLSTERRHLTNVL